MEKEIRKEYSNCELTIIWKPRKCIHATVCVQILPAVYKPGEKPWIKIKNATTEKLIEQINKCPSLALSYYMNNKESKESKSFETEIEVLPNGPLLVYGLLNITDKNGNVEVKDKTTAFCRCGTSNNKYYCDGSHIKINFRDKF